jgi:hypothetical protein
MSVGSGVALNDGNPRRSFFRGSISAFKETFLPKSVACVEGLPNPGPAMDKSI